MPREEVRGRNSSRIRLATTCRVRRGEFGSDRLAVGDEMNSHAEAGEVSDN